MLGNLYTLLPHLSQAYNVRLGVAQGKSASGKRDASYKTLRQPLPDSLFEEHFEGKKAISVQPLLDDGETCQWGAIDIDNYGESDLVTQVRRTAGLFGIPAYIEESKSGGVHVYILLNQPVVAQQFRRALKKLAVWLGHPNAEIRPAQDRINVSEGDLGSFMVLPAFGVGVEKAYEMLSACVVGPLEFNKLTDEGDFIDGPPCLFPLQRMNEARGWQYRNLFLYQLAVFFRYKHPSDWQDRVREYNRDVISPPLDDYEVDALIKQLDKNARCHYMCKKEPFEPVCNRSSCQVRKYGVAAREGVASLISAEGITVFDHDPPVWFVTLQVRGGLETARVKLTTDQLQNVSRFKKRCVEVLKSIPTLPKQPEWEAMVSKLLETAEVIPVPFEMTEAARVLDLLYRFCLTTVKSLNPEDLLKGRVLIEDLNPGVRARFRMVDFMNYMERYRYRGIQARDLYGVLTELSQAGKVKLERIDLAPLQLDVWTIDIDSRYIELKAEIDMEETE